MFAKIAGRIRGLIAGNYNEEREDVQLVLNSRGDICNAPSLPELSELVRQGGSYQVKTATPFAALTTEPTTTAALSLYNGEPEGSGECYLIDSIALWERVVDTTQQNQAAVFVMNNIAPVTAPANANLSIRSLSGRGAYEGKARTVVGGTVVDDGWFPAGPSAPNAAAVAGGAWRVHDFPLRGLYLIPPKGMFSAHVAKIAATASQCQLIFRWHQARLLYTP